MTGQEVAFLILAVIGGLAGLLVVTSRNVVHAALWLVVALASVAGVYLLLAAPSPGGLPLRSLSPSDPPPRWAARSLRA